MPFQIKAARPLAKVAAVEEYLSKKGQEAPAQEAARWLEVRLGELLGPPENHGPATLTRELRFIPAMDRARFRKLAAHRDLVAELVPTSRNRILKAIKQAEASDKPAAEPPHLRVVPDGAPDVFSAVVIDPRFRALFVVIDVTAVSATPSVVPTVDGWDPVSGGWFNLLTGAAITGTLTRVLRIGRGLTAAANLTVVRLPCRSGCGW